MKPKIGILYICTGNYAVFWNDFYESMEKNFVTTAEKHYFVFTDAEHITHEADNPRIHKINQQNLGWPGNTLMRFHIFLNIETQLAGFDYLFFYNANLLVLEPIFASDILPSGQLQLVATIHPGFFNKTRDKFTYDDNKKSTAYIAPNEGEHYFAGGLNGGTSAAFIYAMKTMRENINKDNTQGVVALWHDESHWNRYLIGRTDVMILQPSYLYPEGWVIVFPKIILVRDKSKFGGHEQMRAKKDPLGLKLLTFAKRMIKGTLKSAKNLQAAINPPNVAAYVQTVPLVSASAPALEKYELSGKPLFIITIAYNNAHLIEAQKKLLTDNLGEPYTYIVADNSSDAAKSAEIAVVCARENIAYTKLPPNLFTNDPSRSHGSALNWAYENIVKKYQPEFFGFIDHDIFPFRKTILTDEIRTGMFGLVQTRGATSSENSPGTDTVKWYLWPGFAFYKLADVIQKPLNFMPCDGLDTGGSNFEILYKYVDRKTLSPIAQHYFDIEKKIKLPAFEEVNNNVVETMGTWIHLMRTSNWHVADETNSGNIPNGQKSSDVARITQVVETVSSIFGK